LENEMGRYDRAMKLLVDSSPEAMVRFVLHLWQKGKETTLPVMPITKVSQLSGEFQSEELDADTVLLVEGPEGPLYLVELEFQSTLHPYMPLRSLEYCARAKKKHWKAYGNLPIIAVVIYLFDGKKIPDPPLRWADPNGQTTMVFWYLPIALKMLPRQELLELHEPALWPLALLTEGAVDRIMIESMFTDLIEHKQYDLLSIGHTVAAWLLKGDDLSWLHKEYNKMYEIFRDSPAIQWMEEKARQDERQKAELRLQEERQKALAEQQKALAEERQKALAEQQRTITVLRQTAIDAIALRFPTLRRLANAEVNTFNQVETLSQLLTRLYQVNSTDEMRDLLAALSDGEAEEQG
jgi:hypothetical protein